MFYIKSMKDKNIDTISSIIKENKNFSKKVFIKALYNNKEYGFKNSIQEIEKLEPGIYDIDGNLIKTLSIEEVETDYSMQSCILSSVGMKAELAATAIIPEGTEKLGDFAFSGNKNLEFVKIPDTVVSIGLCTFSNCKKLVDIKLPNSITTLSRGIFQHSGLTSLTLPKYVTIVPEQICYGCQSLESVVIPDIVTEIGNEAFSGCFSLSSVTIPNELTIIRGGAFINCYALTQQIILPNGLKQIWDGAFRGCINIIDITIPDSLIYVSTASGQPFYNVPHITYYGSLSGAPWGAKAMN